MKTDRLEGHVAAMPDDGKLEMFLEMAQAARLDQWLSKEAVTVLAEEALVQLDPRYADPKTLGRFAAKVFSQNYEDAIIAEMIARIGTPNRTFVEIGVGDGSENNTRFLLMQGWSGVWIEGDASSVEAARRLMAEPIAEGRLHVVHGLATVETVNALVSEAIDRRPIDFLSLDIDLNTSHVWRALDLPVRMACIEYNATLPPSLPFEFAYEPDGAWDATNRYGASLKSLEEIGTEKGLALVGCDRHGVNAFFVEEGLAKGRFRAPFTAEEHYQPSRISLRRPRGHAPIGAR